MANRRFGGRIPLAVTSGEDAPGSAGTARPYPYPPELRTSYEA